MLMAYSKHRQEWQAVFEIKIITDFRKPVEADF